VAELPAGVYQGFMGKFALDDLRVYAMAEQLADLVWELVRAW
jgi:hypothetical protein